MDHRARDVSFEKLEPVADPASPRFDRGAVSHPHHQLGGTPLFIQDSPHRLSCLRCQRPMTFLLQFHSDHDLVDFEDGGCAYYWWCSSCSVVGCRTDSL
ncbi:MAG: hypothetical protein HY825_01480 [Acidobacteria bacterium]|nr:hypothetical protein [Acidobacteriota bacterium]